MTENRGKWRLGVLTRTQQMATEIEATLTRMVAGARRDGHTWEEIGTALGVSRQAAYQRFHDAVAEDVSAD